MRSSSGARIRRRHFLPPVLRNDGVPCFVVVFFCVCVCACTVRVLLVRLVCASLCFACVLCVCLRCGVCCVCVCFCVYVCRLCLLFLSVCSPAYINDAHELSATHGEILGVPDARIAESWQARPEELPSERSGRYSSELSSLDSLGHKASKRSPGRDSTCRPNTQHALAWPCPNLAPCGIRLGP